MTAAPRTAPRILLVEDEPSLAGIIKESLEARGFAVAHTPTAGDAWAQYRADRPDAVVLDVMLPDGTGFDLSRRIRTADIETPILFLTARSLPQDVVEGFEAGGSDYLKKPFSLSELVIRLKVLLSKHRVLVETGTTLPEAGIGGYRFDAASCLLTFQGHERRLTARESDILRLLYLHRNRVLDRKSLLLSVWGNDDFFSGRSLDVFITKLRKYLSGDPSVRIVNVRGVGYRLVA
ncbi:MAG TPA: response regulator transcription factor [Dinghuibacter sp.]|uniref:response regulator transcription factor n=1 Tax=Dinghuibacter sp. TaxID=2024697 RepID=UPI002CCC46C7|nr:response regulator transcription factor [Dinghuibacter sp.]HTJ13393.1 response regulator transcription factor [Dinghuibacter sp.]